jgi:hypothetical protein
MNESGSIPLTNILWEKPIYMETNQAMVAYVRRRIKQCRAEGLSDAEIVQTVSVVAGRKLVEAELEQSKPA